MYSLHAKNPRPLSKTSKIDNSGNFSVAGVGLVKVNDAPDRGEVLVKQIDHFFTADKGRTYISLDVFVLANIC